MWDTSWAPCKEKGLGCKCGENRRDREASSHITPWKNARGLTAGPAGFQPVRGTSRDRSEHREEAQLQSPKCPLARRGDLNARSVNAAALRILPPRWAVTQKKMQRWAQSSRKSLDGSAKVKRAMSLQKMSKQGEKEDVSLRKRMLEEVLGLEGKAGSLACWRSRSYRAHKGSSKPLAPQHRPLAFS